jgi:DNA repair protein RecN (Recombination protein N)
MLLELHVKNLALIEKADVEFGEGLNILTGETGAGKSIIIGSVTMALGGKASKDVIRRGADHAYIELIFFVDSKEKKKALMQLGTEPTEEGMVIISRKIMPSRSVSRINDETVTMARLRQITGLLLDIHGQHEHQSLLYKSKHLEILDAYVKAQTQPVKRKIEEEYKNYCKLKERLLSFKTDEDARLREMDFLRFEIQEIENGEVKEGEEEELTLKYRRFAHARRIAEELEKEGIESICLTGAVPKEERLKLVERFSKENVPVFLISLKAGGTGLNLTAADIVIHYDPWWNVAAQNQATDRAHRIGQEKQVTVYRLITKYTIEENI